MTACLQASAAVCRALAAANHPDAVLTQQAARLRVCARKLDAAALSAAAANADAMAHADLACRRAVAAAAAATTRATQLAEDAATTAAHATQLADTQRSNLIDKGTTTKTAAAHAAQPADDARAGPSPAPQGPADLREQLAALLARVQHLPGPANRRARQRANKRIAAIKARLEEQTPRPHAAAGAGAGAGGAAAAGRQQA